MYRDLLNTSKWMAWTAIILCTLATLIAYFAVEDLEDLTLPLLVGGVLVWVLSVVWFLWGWLKNANVENNEGKGISASSYILAFLPLCYCYLMVTDEARTKITVVIENESRPLHSVKIYGSGTIFLKPDTMTLPGIAKGDQIKYKNKAATSPHMQGEIILEGFAGKQKIKKRIAGPFSIHPMRLQQDWKVVINENFLDSGGMGRQAPQ
jgi:hypothetical protein